MKLTSQLPRDTPRSAPRFDLHDNNSVDRGRGINKVDRATGPINHHIHQKNLSSCQLEVHPTILRERHIPAFLNPQMSTYEHRSLPIPEELQGGHLRYSKSVLVTENNRCMVCTSPIASNSRVARTNYGTVHFNCFRCYECNCHLEHSQLYFAPKTKAFYCHADYHEIFSNKCAHCTTPIEGKGMFALGKHWHVGHFFCSECSNPFDRDADYMTINDLPICSDCYAHKTASNCWKCRHKLVGSSQAIEALGRIWCVRCFSCEECDGPFYDDQFILRENGTLVCEHCEQIRIKKAIWGE